MSHTITQAQRKGLRHHFSGALRKVGAFSTGLYAAHGGWHAACQRSIAARG